MRCYRGIGFLLCFLAFCLPAAALDKNLIIGTAGELGVYYPAGGAACRLLNRTIQEHGIHCTVIRTSGSVYNLKAIRSGKMDMAIAQADWIYNAAKGTGDFASSGADTSLRSLFSLHTEVFTVLTRGDSGITRLRELEGRHIGIGDDGSGMRATAEEFIKAEGWSHASFAEVVELKPEEQKEALCSGRVDALFFTTGHPNGNTQKITQHCATRLISVEGPAIDKLLRDKPFYSRATLPGGMYKGSPQSINTFGVKATFVTSSRVDDDSVYYFVKAIFSNLDNYKTLHPVFSTLDKTQMVSEGLIVPLHPGALRYYHEVGLLK